MSTIIPPFWYGEGEEGNSHENSAVDRNCESEETTLKDGGTQGMQILHVYFHSRSTCLIKINFQPHV